MVKSYYCFFILILLCADLSAQVPFQVRFDTITFPGLPGLHSFAAAEYDGKWILLGGRKDGIHEKFDGFDQTNANSDLYMVDPVSETVWSKENVSLPDTLAEQLQSANMAFYQDDDRLFLVGGYGESATAGDHITYPYLTIVDLPALMEAILDDGPIGNQFQTIRDDFFAVTGGQMLMLSDTFYLVGGHFFQGIYSANSGASVTQTYTDAIRKFTLDGGPDDWSLETKTEVIDQFNLHRRDYNLVPQVFDNEELGMIAFAGVFQPGQSLIPFLNIVEIAAEGYSPVAGFNQFMANYHCARVSLYESEVGATHTLFFGGMSQYRFNGADSLIQDNNIPFVKTASRVSRYPGGNYEEVAFADRLPFYTGTGAEFLFSSNLPLFAPGIIDYGQLPAGETLLGYIVGGIVTPDNEPNPFLNNNFDDTYASTVLLKVYLDKNPVSSVDLKPLDGHFDLKTQVFPNPARTQWQVSFEMPRSGAVTLFLQNALGQIIRRDQLGILPSGTVQSELSAKELSPGVYRLTIAVDGVFLDTQTITKQ